MPTIDEEPMTLGAAVLVHTARLFLARADGVE